MTCPINVWELWADGSTRLTTTSNLLNLILWEEGGGWHFRVIQIGGLQLKFSRKPLPDLAAAQKACARAASQVLNNALKALEKVQ